jgi:hypothetical protein
MKTALLIVGGVLCVSSWQASAADANADQSAGTPNTVLTSEGAPPSAGVMSGDSAVPIGKTRGQVYQELLQSERNGEAARLRELYKGGH